MLFLIRLRHTQGDALKEGVEGDTLKEGVEGDTLKEGVEGVIVPPFRV